MDKAINLLSVIPMRKEPAHRSEMVSQLLFGEYVEMLEEEKDFVKVKGLYDGYEGWVQKNQLTVTDQILQTHNYVGVWFDEVLVNGRCNTIPFGSPVYQGTHPLKFGNTEIRYVVNPEHIWDSSQKQWNSALLQKVCSFFLDTPYLWGGKSVFGIDCSGFVQQVFKMFGIKLLRDAYMQAEQGSEIKSLSEVTVGDLAFFQNDNGKIVHVGIVLERNKIVHASGKVTIDIIDEKGIVNVDTGKRTHQLHSIRRII